MKTSLDHLPEDKQNTIEEIRRVILNEVDEFVASKVGKKSLSRVVWVVLFGSYARGDFVESPETGYVSDFDILVIMNRAELVEELGLWHSIEDKVDRYTRSPLTLIIHSQKEVIKWLQEGHYFFNDIQKEGIYLHSHSGKPLPEPKLMSNDELLPVAENHFKQWFEGADEFLIDYRNAYDRGNHKLAAFYLHQACERFYSALLLVLSNYRPKTHNLKKLHQMSVEVVKKDASLIELFPGKDKFQRRSFELLKRAYVDSRCSDHFNITQTELGWLYQQAELLKKASKKTLSKSH